MSSLRDPASGLLTAAYFEVAVPQRVAVARRGLRPLSVVLIDADLPGATPGERAEVALACLRDADTACQLPGGIIGLLLDDTPEDGAIWTAERLRRELAARWPEATVRAGVATYPSQSLDADELLAAARRALALAGESPGSRIEVAPQQA